MSSQIISRMKRTQTAKCNMEVKLGYENRIRPKGRNTEEKIDTTLEMENSVNQIKSQQKASPVEWTRQQTKYQGLNIR